MQYVNVLLWVLMIVLITAIGCSAVAILWVEIQKEKYVELGRELEREDKGIKFKKTPARRVRNFWCALGCGPFKTQSLLDKHIFTNHGAEFPDSQVAQVPTVFVKPNSKTSKGKRV